jgi:hypothetical protein
MNNTKKRINNKKKTKRQKFIHKNRLIGGVGGDSSLYNRGANEIMNQIKKEHNINLNLGNLPFFKTTKFVAEGLLLKGIEHIGTIFNINFSDSADVSKKLQQIKIALADPRNKEKIREIFSEAAKVGVIALEAADPFIQPLVNKSIKVGSEALSKIGESAVKIGLNTAEEIPILGVVIGIIRSLSNAGEAFFAVTNAASEMLTISSDSLNGAKQNYERLMKEKTQGLNRINQSVNTFQQPFNKPNLLSMSNKLPGFRGGFRRLIF